MSDADMTTGALADIVREQAATRPDAPALFFGDETITFLQLDQRSTQTANLLPSQGVAPGDFVAIVSRNRPEYYEVLLGASKAGAVTVPVNWRLTSREIVHPITDAGARVIIVDDTGAALVNDARSQLPDETTILRVGADPDGGEATYDVMRAAQSTVDEPVARASTDTALLFYTSGTSGRPKGVMTSERALAVHLAAGADSWDFDADAVNLVSLPLFHVGGCCWGFAPWTAGGSNVLLPDASTGRILEAISEHGVTHAFFVPTLLRSVLDDPASTPDRLSTLRAVIYGGSPIPDDLLRRSMEVLGCGFYGGYGLTESTASATLLPPEDHVLTGPNTGRLRSVGRPRGDVEARVVDPDSGEDRPAGETGEIWLRSVKVMGGYWNRPDATARALTADRWLRTGDAGHLDEDGYLYVSGRLDDMIITGGENVHPADVENVLSGHPAVSEVAVIGVPDPRWGQSVAALIVPNGAPPATSAGIEEFTRERLAAYKCPKVIRFVDSLPKNASGKVLKYELRAAYEDELAEALP